jgi:serine protease Do
MRNAAITFGVLALLVPAGRGQRADKPRLAPLLAVQEALEELIADTEGSVGCILVSRSAEYENWRAGPPAPGDGKLGRFDSNLARQSLGRRPRKEDVERLNAIALDHPDHTPESYGTGIVIDVGGLILTNAHVVRNATKVYVRLPGGKGSYADIYASDPRSDLAVLKLLDPPDDLKPIKFGDGDKVRKGQFVVVLSHQFAAGFRDGSPSASVGMISNLRRRAPGARTEFDRERQTLHHHGTLLQVDTQINLGASGGALLNIKGELIGITTSLAALSGIETPGGFAVPLDAGMRRIIEVLRRGQEVEYGFLGVHLAFDNTNQKNGVPITGVATGSPAQQARLSMADTIVGINGMPIRDNDDLFLLVGANLAGSTVRLEVANLQGQKRFVPVKLAKYYVPGPVIAAQRPPAHFGLRVDYSSILLQRINWPVKVTGGVVIREVVPNSPAEKSDLQVDKVISRVDNRSVTSPAEFYQAMEKAGPSVEITLVDPSDGREENITLQSK